MVLVSKASGKVNHWSPLKNALVQGNIASSTGQEGSSTTRLRANGYISVRPDTTYCINATGAATQYFIVEYSDDYQYKNHYSGWKQLGINYTTDASTKYIRVILAKASGTITPEEVTSVSITKVKNANLWNRIKNALVQGDMSTTNGQEVASTTRVRTSGYIEVTPSKMYRINATGAATQYFVFEFADGHQYKSHYSGWTEFTVKYEVDSSTKYIRLLLAKASGTITPEEVTSVSIVEVT